LLAGYEKLERRGEENAKGKKVVLRKNGSDFKKGRLVAGDWKMAP
jgi:hypothetical protein